MPIKCLLSWSQRENQQSNVRNVAEKQWWAMVFYPKFVFKKVFVNVNVTPLKSFPWKVTHQWRCCARDSSVSVVFSISMTSFWIFSKVLKWPPLRTFFSLRKVTRNEVRWIGGLGNQRHAFRGKKKSLMEKAVKHEGLLRWTIHLSAMSRLIQMTLFKPSGKVFI